MTDKQYTLDQLQRLVETRRIAVETAQKTLDEAELELERYEALLEKAQLEAYWDSGNGLRLNEGDELLITAEARQWMRERKAIGMSWFTWPDVNPKVHKVDAKSGMAYVIDFGCMVAAPIELVQGMRAAWLTVLAEKIAKLNAPDDTP